MERPYDAAIVGASLAGCTAAIALARKGARVALIEQHPDAGAFKRICGHFIQPSAVPVLERLGALEAMIEQGAVCSWPRLWTRWGWIEAPAGRADGPAPLNLRREKLDPLLRALAARTPGVELMLGRFAESLEGNSSVEGVTVRDRAGGRERVRAKVVVGADGRGSRIAKLAGVRVKSSPHGRIVYAAYFEGPAPAGAPDASVWFMDPDWYGAFPTDDGLTLYACMPTKRRLDEFRRDPEGAVIGSFARLPEGPPIEDCRLVELPDGSRVLGKLDMTNLMRAATAPGLALVGDAALAADPVWAVGCGWALQSGEWLAESVAPALLGAEPLTRGLARYRRKHTRALSAHVWMINDYSTGRRFNRGERLLFSAAAHDARVAAIFGAYGGRSIGPARMLATAVPLAVAAHARGRVRRGAAAGGGAAGTSARTPAWGAAATPVPRAQEGARPEPPRASIRETGGGVSSREAAGATR